MCSLPVVAMQFPAVAQTPLLPLLRGLRAAVLSRLVNGGPVLRVVEWAETTLLLMD